MQVGDIVKKIDTYWYGRCNESRDDIGRLYVISKVSGEYEIRDLQTGGASAWWRDDQLKYIGKARDDIFEILDRIEKRLAEHYTSKEYIKRRYGRLTLSSWLRLFDEIGYAPPFLYNGEYFCLYEDINTFKPLFDKMFIDHDVDAALDMIDKLLKEEYCQKYKQSVKAFYERWFDKTMEESEEVHG